MRSNGFLNLLQEKRGRTGKNLIKDQREDTMGGTGHAVISDSLCGRDKVLVFISNAFFSCGF